MTLRVLGDITIIVVGGGVLGSFLYAWEVRAIRNKAILAITVLVACGSILTCVLDLLTH